MESGSWYPFTHDVLVMNSTVTIFGYLTDDYFHSVSMYSNMDLPMFNLHTVLRLRV